MKWTKNTAAQVRLLLFLSHAADITKAFFIIPFLRHIINLLLKQSTYSMNKLLREDVLFQTKSKL